MKEKGLILVKGNRKFKINMEQNVVTENIKPPLKFKSKMQYLPHKLKENFKRKFVQKSDKIREQIKQVNKLFKPVGDTHTVQKSRGNNKQVDNREYEDRVLADLVYDRLKHKRFGFQGN